MYVELYPHTIANVDRNTYAITHIHTRRNQHASMPNPINPPSPPTHGDSTKQNKHHQPKTCQKRYRNRTKKKNSTMNLTEQQNLRKPFQRPKKVHRYHHSKQSRHSISNHLIINQICISSYLRRKWYTKSRPFTHTHPP
jgi:hypothetical protein